MKVEEGYTEEYDKVREQCMREVGEDGEWSKEDRAKLFTTKKREVRMRPQSRGLGEGLTTGRCLILHGNNFTLVEGMEPDS